MVIHKLLAIGIGIYLAGDPSLSMLSAFNESKEGQAFYLWAKIAVIQGKTFKLCGEIADLLLGRF